VAAPVTGTEQTTSEEQPPSPPPPAFQLGYVVPDLEAAIRKYDRQAPGHVWTIWTYDGAQMAHLGDGTSTVPSVWRLALNDADPQVEFIQPIEGDNTYTQFLCERRSGGLHHYGMFVRDVAAAVRPLQQERYSVCFEGIGHGASQDGHFVYLTPPPDPAGVVSSPIIELIKPPTTRLEPDATMDLRQ